MRPELTVLNARLAKARREKERAKKKEQISYTNGFSHGKAIASNYGPGGSRLFRAVVHEDDYTSFMVPFDERYKIAKERLAHELAKKIIEIMDIEHEKTPFGEEWRACIPIGDIKKVYMPPFTGPMGGRR